MWAESALLLWATRGEAVRAGTALARRLSRRLRTASRQRRAARPGRTGEFEANPPCPGAAPESSARGCGRDGRGPCGGTRCAGGGASTQPSGPFQTRPSWGEEATGSAAIGLAAVFCPDLPPARATRRGSGVSATAVGRACSQQCAAQQDGLPPARPAPSPGDRAPTPSRSPGLPELPPRPVARAHTHPGRGPSRGAPQKSGSSQVSLGT